MLRIQPINLTPYIFALAVLALMSCEKSVEMDTETPPSPTESLSAKVGGPAVEFRIKGELGTKATPVISLSSFRVLTYTGTPGSSETTVAQSTFTLSEDVFRGGQFWPKDDLGYHFYASNRNITASSSGAYIEASVSSNIDIVVSKLDNPTYKEVNHLEFDHILARVGRCTFESPSDYTVTYLRVYLTPLVSGNYHIHDGTWTDTLPSGSTTTLTQEPDDLSDTNTWLLPGTYTLTVEYICKRGYFVADYTGANARTCTVTLESGKISHLQGNLPVNAGTEIFCQVQLTPWVDNNIVTNFD